MLNPIVVGVDFSPEARRAAILAALLARRTGSPLRLVHVRQSKVTHNWLPEFARSWAETTDQEARTPRLLLEALSQHLELDNSHIATSTVDGRVEDALSQVAADYDAPLVVVGSRGRTGLRRFLLGSVAERMLRRCPTSLLIARDSDAQTRDLRRLLVPIDFSPLSHAAVSEAMLYAGPGAKLELVYCAELPVVPGAGVELNAALTSDLEAHLVDQAEQRGMELLRKYELDMDVDLSFEILRGAAAPAIVRHARQSQSPYDAIVIGSHSRAGFARLLLGSVCEAVARYAPCSVMIVRDPAHADLAEALRKN